MDPSRGYHQLRSYTKTKRKRLSSPRRNMEIYVDDMLVKSKEKGHHLENLREIFEQLRFSRLQINTEKALSRFISKSEERNLPFFKNLRRASKETFRWDEKCAQAFNELKEYLASPKLLSRPEPMEELQLYLAISDGEISSVLVREAGGIQNPIYYVSHMLYRDEENYPTIDKFAFAIIIPARKLKIYFEAYPIRVITDQQLKRVLVSPSLSGRLTTWAIELSEFDISYEPRVSIKSRALTDFIIECTARPPQRVIGLEESCQEPMLE
ncbi:hypothetical protein LIER_15358 [Lithospermum erythrorhizon]|uniref:Reverse transcriptase/retrotransposon-derived protein RNase H-like domain-containing protein n=1 Tax=Lithospermum erythrorhizon TaxID=34254 RepID=A0AAV3Q754_LITER